MCSPNTWMVTPQGPFSSLIRWYCIHAPGSDNSCLSPWYSTFVPLADCHEGDTERSFAYYLWNSDSHDWENIFIGDSHEAGKYLSYSQYVNVGLDPRLQTVRLVDISGCHGLDPFSCSLSFSRSLSRVASGSIVVPVAAETALVLESNWFFRGLSTIDSSPSSFI
jgi:hypothetical protein